MYGPLRQYGFVRLLIMCANLLTMLRQGIASEKEKKKSVTWGKPILPQDV